MQRPTIRVVIADDQELFRAGFRLILEQHDDIKVIGEATDGVEAVRVAESLSPDIVLMDIRMPVMDGVEATAQVCARTEARVIILTMFDSDEYVYDGLRAGASGFLLKDTRRDNLVEGVRTVACGEAMLAPSVARRLIEGLSRHGSAVPRLAAQLGGLTGREADTLRLVARGLTNAEIGRSLHLSENTVKTHMSNLLSKLHLRDRAQAVVFAYESGLIVAGSD